MKRRRLASKIKNGTTAGISTTNAILFRKSFGFHFFYGAAYFEEESSEIRTFSEKRDIANLMKIGKRLGNEFNFAVFIAWALILLPFLTKSNYNFSTAIWTLAFYLLQKDFVNGVICQIFNINKSQSLSRNHAAEHMVINAYEVLGKIPTLEEARQGSKVHIRCGSCIPYKVCFEMITSIILLNTVGVIWTNFKGIEIGVAILWMLFIELIDRKFVVSRYMQLIALREPTDIELSMAIEALKVMDKAYEESKNRFRQGYFEEMLPDIWLNF